LQGGLHQPAIVSGQLSSIAVNLNRS
jgi:hypothetical protein